MGIQILIKAADIVFPFWDFTEMSIDYIYEGYGIGMYRIVLRNSMKLIIIYIEK